MACLPASRTGAFGSRTRYLDGTRLRLRRATDGTTQTRKLTQKIAAADGGPGLITTLYLSEREFEALAGLPAAVLTKTRLSFPPLGVDVFDGPLTGLVLAEAEFDDAESASAFTEPEGAVADVTADERFAGGTLARASAEAVSSALASFGLALARAAAPRAFRG